MMDDALLPTVCSSAGDSSRAIRDSDQPQGRGHATATLADCGSDGTVSTSGRTTRHNHLGRRFAAVVGIAAATAAMIAPVVPSEAFATSAARCGSASSTMTIGDSAWRQRPYNIDHSTKFDDRRRHHRSSRLPLLLLRAAPTEYNDEDGEYDDDEEASAPPTVEGFDFDEDEADLPTPDELRAMTVAQLKQQLRLRGKKLTGNKAQLVERLSERSSSANGAVVVDGAELPPEYSRYEKPATSNKAAAATEDNDKERSGSEGKSKGDDKKSGERVAEARARGADVVDVSDFIDAEEVGKSFRSSDRPKVVDAVIENDDESDDAGEDGEGASTESSSSSSPEVWGEDARIVEDYEGRSVVVDGLSRAVVEFTGAGGAKAQAYVVGSRDSLKNFMKGGDAAKRQQQQSDDDEEEKSETKTTTYSSMEEEVYAIQQKREAESKRGLIRPDEAEGAEDSSDPGAAYSTVERDDGDWGVYTPMGARLSASEVRGVLLLSDVYGHLAEDTRAPADKIAFECQPAVVLVPDVFRGRPWVPVERDGDDGDDAAPKNEEGESYERWRAGHPAGRVDTDVRAAAAVLRRRYAAASVTVWGTCYGGGRALEAAAGWHIDDDNDSTGGVEAAHQPPPADPIAAVAWYPTRYDTHKLFGSSNEGSATFAGGEDRRVAVMAVFGGDDKLPGAMPEDAALLRERLAEDGRIKDHMVKGVPGLGPRVSHSNLAGGDGGDLDDDSDRFTGEDYGADPSSAVGGGGDVEVACLLSTAWMETYARVFLPTAGAPVKDDDGRWSALGMDEAAGGSGRTRETIRADLDEAVYGHMDMDVDLGRMARSRSPMWEESGPGTEAFDEVEDERERTRRQILEKYDIREDDDEATFDRKFERAREDGALDGLLLDAYMDDSGDAYW